MTVEQHSVAAPIAAAQPKPSELAKLQQQITNLSVQVSALTTQQMVNKKSQPFGESRPKKCFICNKVGQLQYYFTCGQQGHGWRNCLQKNEQAVTAWSSSHPCN